MKRQLCQREVPAESDALAESVPARLAKIYAARGVSEAADLDLSLQRLPSPQGLLGMAEAVALLLEALEQKQSIVIVADFDADGATSCALMVSALQALGADEVQFVVPDRARDGYGLSPSVADAAAATVRDAQGALPESLLITVDNGISSHAGVAHAQALGFKVLITDHHLPGDTVPSAEALVNPNQPGDRFPSKALAGVGVAFYVLLGLRTALRERGWFEHHPEPNLADWLDLVALGTVADLVPLDGVNRILVAQGIARIRRGQARAGIRALLEVGKRDASRLVASDLGFTVGPRINAAGRLESMRLGIECLLAGSEPAARWHAQQLDQINHERRGVEQRMRAQAEAALRELHLEDDLPWGVSLFQEDWHEGVVGLVAGRVKEQIHRPVFVFAEVQPGLLKGSGRSIPGLHLRDALATLNARHPDMMERFGGHAMAAGLTLPRAQFAAFAAAFDQVVRMQMNAADLEGVVWTDGALAVGEMRLDLAQALRDGGPWGQAFPEPVFADVFEVSERRVVGDQHLRWQLTHRDGGRFQAIHFNPPAELLQGPVPAQLQAAYRLDVNHWQGRDQLQLCVEYAEPV
jgi:single-stranded-DNA-specific exonuclease